jgi:anti-sigma factor RsiW
MTSEHERASELLPWYVNATLDAGEAALVEKHLGSCDACREELARCQDLQSAAQGEDEGWSPSPAHFARVLDSVDRAETPLWRRVSGWIRETPRPMRFAFALQGAAVVALGAALILQPVAHTYETLSRPQVTATSSRARLHVVFAPDLTESGMRQLLQSVQGTIVDGPSPAGLYTVELAFSASERERAGQIAEHLAADPQVRFAVPVAR